MIDSEANGCFVFALPLIPAFSPGEKVKLWDDFGISLIEDLIQLLEWSPFGVRDSLPRLLLFLSAGGGAVF